MEYTTPTVDDYGTVSMLTKAAAFQGYEDGAIKLELVIPHHSVPVGP